MKIGDLGYSVRVNERGFRELEKLTVEVSAKAVKAFGTIYARAMAAATPPHDGSQVAGDVLRTKKQEDITELQKVISLNIAGVESPAEIAGFAKPVPYRNLSGSWLAIDPTTNRPAKPRGEFGFVVPTSWARVRKQTVPETEPEQVYKMSAWDGKKRVPFRRRVSFVRKAKLAALVRKQQKQAGKLISGWAPGARVFAEGKSIAVGFFAELGGKGFGKICYDKKGLATGMLVNKQAYNARQNELLLRRMPWVMRRTKVARAMQLKNIAEWYYKKGRKV